MFENIKKLLNGKSDKDLSTPQAEPEQLIQQSVTNAHSRRDLVADHFTGSISPYSIARALLAAQHLQDIRAQVDLAETMEEKDPKYRSLLNTRKQALAGSELIVEAGGNKRVDKQAAELVKTLVSRQEFSDTVLDLLDAVGKGFSVVEMEWGVQDGFQVPVGFTHRPAKFFQYDKVSGTKLVLSGQNGPEELKPFKFLVHQPRLKTGLPIRGGLARAAAGSYMIKMLARQDWLAFLEVFGQPTIVGKYKNGANAEQISVIRRAVQSLGKDSRAVMSTDLELDFKSAANVNTDAWERVIRYEDEQLSQLILGQTLTSSVGNSGSRALGDVHNEVRIDLMRADARQLCATLTEQLVKLVVFFNFGESAAVPTLRFQIDEPQDLVGLATVLEKLVPLGLPVDSEDILARLGLPLPKAGARLLGAPQAAEDAPAEEVSLNNALPHCEMHNTGGKKTRDGIDELADEIYNTGAFQRMTAAFSERAAKSKATNLEGLKADLLEAANSMDATELQDLLIAARLKARGVGEEGGEY